MLHVSALFKYIVSKFFPSSNPIFRDDPALVEACSSEIDTKWQPRVSIVIPTRDKSALLRECIDSIFELTEYSNFQITVIDNGSREVETFDYFKVAIERGCEILDFPHNFNFSKICNFAVSSTRGEIVCLLNNDTRVVESTWLTALVNHLNDQSVGIVGSILKYPDGKIQHDGLALGFRGIAASPGQGSLGIEAKQCLQVSAVTFACAAFRRETFEELGGLDEKLEVGLNDVDYCIRSEKAGKRNIVCGKSTLIHHESASRLSMKSMRGILQAAKEIRLFLRKHPKWSASERTFEVV
jgi:GT2 family glycosyltransferase